jgi:hypothetical protein
MTPEIESIVLSILLLLQSLVGNTVEIKTTEARTPETPLVLALPVEDEEYIKKRIREVFNDAPVMWEVARCESRNSQHGSDGKPLQGIVNNSDTGVFQINKFYHLERSKKLGYDIDIFEGNLQYARLLYNEKGTQPWNASVSCWNKNN